MNLQEHEKYNPEGKFMEEPLRIEKYNPREVRGMNLQEHKRYWIQKEGLRAENLLSHSAGHIFTEIVDDHIFRGAVVLLTLKHCHYDNLTISILLQH